MPHNANLPHHAELWAIPSHMAEHILRSIYVPPAGASVAVGGPNTAIQDTPLYTVTQGIAVIGVNGTLTRTAVISAWTGKVITQGQDYLRDALEAALADPTVLGILFTINSPGGTVPGTKELADAIAYAGTRKTCAAYVDGLAASAAYWLASATGRIYAPVTASVGSIGVIMVHTDYSRWHEQSGVAYTAITSGKFKDVGSDDRPLSAEDRAYFQQRVTSIHTIFKADVAAHMGITAPEGQWAEAQIFLAAEALSLGLITATVQDMQAAIAILVKETLMDKETLAAQHPDVLAQIQAEAKQEADAESHARLQATLTVVKAVGGEQVFSAIKSTMEMCAAAKLTSEQMQALAPVLALQHSRKTSADALAVAQPAAAAVASGGGQDPTGEQIAMQQILSRLQATSTQPLAAAPQTVLSPQAKSPLIADAEHRAQNVILK